MYNMAPCQRFEFYIVFAQWMARELVGRVLPVHVGFAWSSSSHGPLAFWPGHALASALVGLWVASSVLFVGGP